MAHYAVEPCGSLYFPKVLIFAMGETCWGWVKWIIDCLTDLPCFLDLLMRNGKHLLSLLWISKWSLLQYQINLQYLHFFNLEVEPQRKQTSSLFQRGSSNVCKSSCILLFCYFTKFIFKLKISCVILKCFVVFDTRTPVQLRSMKINERRCDFLQAMKAGAKIYGQQDWKLVVYDLLSRKNSA